MRSAAMRMFPPSDRDRIAEAVRQAESKTAGEIVPYVVHQSDHYEVAEWRAGFLLGGCAFLGMTVARSFESAWIPFDPVMIAALTLLASAIGMLAVRFVPALLRVCAGKHLIDRRVEARAAEAFISEEVFHTHGRTGILIYLSLLERRVLVVGDSGINAKVQTEDWHGIIHRVVEGIRRGKPADGLVDAILQCGTLLERHGVARGRGKTDELANDLRIGRNG